MRFILILALWTSANGIAQAAEAESSADWRLGEGRVDYQPNRTLHLPVIRESGYAGAVVSIHVSGDMISMQYLEGPLSCGSAVGRYRFQLMDDAVQFSLVEDKCEDRRAVLLGGPFRRVKPPYGS